MEDTDWVRFSEADIVEKRASLSQWLQAFYSPASVSCEQGRSHKRRKASAIVDPSLQSTSCELYSA